jgi:Predicted metal-dependent hydrolase of the TIM-barrel fold
MLAAVDAHQHFWDLERGSYPWLTVDDGLLYASFLPADLVDQLDGAGVHATIVVQATQSDTPYLLRLADRHCFIRAVIGWVPVDDPVAAAAALAAYCPRPAFAGVRYQPAQLSEQLLAGLHLLAELDLTLDLAPRGPAELARVGDLAGRLPGLRVVVDHLGNPAVDGLDRDEWLKAFALVASRPNVFAKISGLATPDDGSRPTADELRPVVESAIELFGPHRLMAGSDWPVSTQAATYRESWLAIRALLDHLPVQDQEAILGSTVRRAYPRGRW